MFKKFAQLKIAKMTTPAKKVAIDRLYYVTRISDDVKKSKFWSEKNYA